MVASVRPVGALRWWRSARPSRASRSAPAGLESRAAQGSAVLSRAGGRYMQTPRLECAQVIRVLRPAGATWASVDPSARSSCASALARSRSPVRTASASAVARLATGYRLCPRRSATVLLEAWLTGGDRRILAERRGPQNTFKSSSPTGAGAETATARHASSRRLSTKSIGASGRLVVRSSASRL
jgi:hypothetical protein